MENTIDNTQELDQLVPDGGDNTAADDSKLINQKFLTTKDYVLFALARFASSAVTGLVQGYLLFFFTVCVGISPTDVGLMFLITKIFDGLNDPVMGMIVDKTRTRWGKMRPYLVLGAVPWAIVTILLFMPVTSFSSAGKIAWMYVTYILYDITGTIVGVPLDGIPAVASPNMDERSKMISVSRILGSIGEQSALVLISIGLLISNDDYTNTYMVTAIIIGILGPLFMVLGGVRVKERCEPTETTPSLLEGFKYMFKNKPFLLLILSNLLTFFRNLVSAAIMYVVAYIYNDGSLQIAFALPGAIASMIGMMFAPKLKRMMDSKKLFIFATIWHSAALAIIFFIYLMGGTNFILIAALMFVAMLPVGVLNVVPHLMATDTLDYWEDKTGERLEGITFSLMSLRSKVSSGFKDYFLSWLLAFFLFSQPLSFLNDHTPAQTEFTKMGIFMIFTIIPAITNLVSIVPMLFYNLSGKKMAEIELRLAHKRKAEYEAKLAAEQGEAPAEGEAVAEDGKVVIDGDIVTETKEAVAMDTVHIDGAED